MTHDEMIEVIKAHKEGKKLQCRPKSAGRLDYPWQDLQKDEVPVWDFPHVEYRVKPVPLVFYARIGDEGQIGSINKDRKHIEVNYRTFGGRIVKLVEVPEE